MKISILGDGDGDRVKTRTRLMPTSPLHGCYRTRVVSPVVSEANFRMCVGPFQTDPAHIRASSVPLEL